MKNKDAIEILKTRKKFIHEMDINSHIAFDMAIEALEKQIPKKPNYNYSDEPLCPYCQEVIDDGDTICEFCHQLIDWSDEE